MRINLILWILKLLFLYNLVPVLKYKFDPMDFETIQARISSAYFCQYKFDPMDFETLLFYSSHLLHLKYKFDPMDFETTKEWFWISLPKSINLILWILKPIQTLSKWQDLRYKFDPMDFETSFSIFITMLPAKV